AIRLPVATMPRRTIQAAVALSLLSIAPASADWKPVQRVETYPVSGATGIEIYRSIGEGGPRAGTGRAIATTTFDLKWSRDYVPENGGCTLKKARPHLIVITTLPRPTRKLPAATQALWDTFIEGIRVHEAVHGDHIVDMVRQIEALSVGFRAENDPKCRKIREELTKRLAVLSQEQRARSRDFDRVELSEGGAVHQLVLALVNG